MIEIRLFLFRGWGKIQCNLFLWDVSNLAVKYQDKLYTVIWNHIWLILIHNSKWGWISIIKRNQEWRGRKRKTSLGSSIKQIKWLNWIGNKRRPKICWRNENIRWNKARRSRFWDSWCLTRKYSRWKRWSK